MIKVKYISNLFEDKRIEFETRNQSLPAIFMTLFKKYPETRNDNNGGLSIRVNGKKISPFQWGKLKLKDGDRITFIQEVGIAEIGLVWGFITAGVTGGLGYGAVALAAVKLVFWISTIAYTIYSYTKSPKSSHGNLPSNNALDNSPTYGWEGIKMSIDTRIPVPVVYGEHLVGGNIKIISGRWV